MSALAYLCLGGSEEESPGGSCQVQAVHNSTDEDGLQVPGVGCWAGNHTVLGQSNHSTIVEHCQQHNQQSWEVPAANMVFFEQHASVKVKVESSGTESGVSMQKHGS